MGGNFPNLGYQGYLGLSTTNMKGIVNDVDVKLMEIYNLNPQYYTKVATNDPYIKTGQDASQKDQQGEFKNDKTSDYKAQAQDVIEAQRKAK